MRLIIKVLFLFYLSNALASEFLYLGRSPRALLMGDAYTAIADDEYTLFYNPASLSKNPGLSLSPMNPSFGLTNALSELDRFDDFPENDPAAIAGRITGMPIYLATGANPGFKMGPFGLSLFASASTSLILRNSTHPSLEMNYRTDRGFIAGYSHSFGSKGKKRKGKIVGHNMSSVGIALKYIDRRGLSGNFDLYGSKLYSRIIGGSSDITELRKSLGYSEGKAWGVDLGFEQVITKGNTQLSWAASVLDIGGTDFRKISGTGVVPEQEMFVGLGAAVKQDYFIFDYTFSIDLKPINEAVSFGRMLHLGLEVGLPILTVYGGYSEGYLSYGVGIDLWMFELIAGFYSVEAGSGFKEEEASRAVLYLSLLDFSFDA